MPPIEAHHADQPREEAVAVLKRGQGVGLATRLPAAVRAADVHFERERLRPLLGRRKCRAELAAPHNAVCATAERAVQPVSAAVEPERGGVI